MDPLRRKMAAEERVRDALVCNQQAQRLLDRAAMDLSSMQGMAVEWQRLGVLHDRARRCW